MLVSMIKGQDEYKEERVAAIKALYMLSFDEANKEMIKSDPDTMALLRSLQTSDNKEIQKVASGVLWEIEGKKKHSGSSGTLTFSIVHGHNKNTFKNTSCFLPAHRIWFSKLSAV